MRGRLRLCLGVGHYIKGGSSHDQCRSNLNPPQGVRHPSVTIESFKWSNCDIMDANTLLLVLFPVLTAIISSYLTYYFAMKSKRDEAILRFKEEKYSNLLIHLQGFVGETASGRTKKKFFEEQYKSWLYSSDGVVQAINEMVQLVIESRGEPPNPERGRKAVGDIVIEMRKDLLGNSKLSPRDFRYTTVIEDGHVRL